MARADINPLFADSTKFQGEMIVTEFEVCELELEKGLSVFAKVTTGDGEEKVLPLEQEGQRTWRGHVRLEYQEDIAYEFIVSDGFQVVQQTPIFNTLACYSVGFNWQKQSPSETDQGKQYRMSTEDSATPGSSK